MAAVPSILARRARDVGSFLDWLQRPTANIPPISVPDRIEQMRFVGRFASLPLIGEVPQKILGVWPERTMASFHNVGSGDVRIAFEPMPITAETGLLIEAGLAQDIENITGEVFAVGAVGHALLVSERIRSFR